MRKVIIFGGLLVILCTGALAQVTTVGLIGDATPGGWDADTNMLQDPNDTAIWTLTITLNNGEAKFRANDAWDVNWGAEDFPVGIGLPAGDNIQVDSGEYNIRFNHVTGAYNFARVAEFNSVGLVGTATPYGVWDRDTNMIQDTADPNLWYLTVDLVDGDAKFRADDDWAVNWGNSDFPVGVGYQEGTNIPVFAGRYDITFNSLYGDYAFAVQSPIGIIGTATSLGNWDTDINMYQDQTDSNKFFLTADLVAGDLKFRQDDDWDINWGASDFPSGIGVKGGDNIPIPNAGEFMILFDTSTGAYEFIENVEYDNVGIVGDATANGWDSITYMTKDGSDPNLYTINIDLTDGGVQFTANDGAVVWGADGFPTDTAVVDGDTIPVVAGKYVVSFNASTGIYNFEEVIIYDSIGIIGTATPIGDWETDVDMVRSDIDPTVWTLRVELMDGELKFRADNDWAVSWGAGDFPTGVATTTGPNIPVTAGDYLIRFNTFTGDYSFELIVEYDAISLVGKSGPFGDWPLDASEDMGERDTYLVVDPDDPQSWSAKEVALTAHMGADDDGVKFRADTSWTVNWGAEDFPAGIGIQNGPNIVTVAGTFDITFNSATGEYAFLEPGSVATRDFLKPSDVKIYPNPASEILTLDVQSLQLAGQVNLQVYDMSGHLLISQRQLVSEQMQVNISKLIPGNYALQIFNEQVILGKRFSVSR